MKKYFIFIVALFMLSFTASTYAGCPPGYEQHTIYGIYTYPPNFTCHVTIKFCCKWDNNLKRLLFEIDEIMSRYSGGNPNGGDCIVWVPDLGHFNAWVHEYIVKNANRLCMPEYPPCDDENNYYTFVEIQSAACVYYDNVFISPYPGEDPIWKTVSKSCSSDLTKCKTTWKICIDYSMIPPSQRILFVSREVIGTPSCQTARPTLPPEGKSWNEAWTTPCFLAGCE